MKQRIAKSLGAVLLLGGIPMAWAQTLADLPAQKWTDYAWPTESSSEPKDEEWEKATQLEEVKAGADTQWSWANAACSARVVREWIKLTCGARVKSNDEFLPLLGVIWGMAGDLSTLKGSFSPASELDRYKTPPKDDNERLTRKMGGQATTVFQAKPGTAFVLQIDEMFWNENYEGVNVETRTGMTIDVSWAAGEKSPSILLR